MDAYTIQPAAVADEQSLWKLFSEHLTHHSEYISHGEIQMGVGQEHYDGNQRVTMLSANARHFWMKYIHANILDPERSAVYKAVDMQNQIVGFCVVEIQEDGAAPYGMICDILVNEAARGTGIGKALLKTALQWLHQHQVQDVYLESGLQNLDAHAYFERQGFVKVSEIYKLKSN